MINFTCVFEISQIVGSLLFTLFSSKNLIQLHLFYHSAKIDEWISNMNQFFLILLIFIHFFILMIYKFFKLLYRWKGPIILLKVINLIIIFLIFGNQNILFNDLLKIIHLFQNFFAIISVFNMKFLKICDIQVFIDLCLRLKQLGNILAH